uniref:Family with sequence similarity 183 member A n=1 Tax=Sinocyclocheilus rhinocerous TaxID=307959 RepID=A0A673K9W0_9TELE
MANPKEKDPVDIVHQNAIHVETIMKELRHQKLTLSLTLSPSRNVMHILTDQEDPAFVQAIHKARLEPTKKYSHPQTEAQEIGWLSSPLERSYLSIYLYLSITFSVAFTFEITKYMDAAWRLKEQTQNLG